MDHDTVDWIDAYMQWTHADSWTFGPDRLTHKGLDMLAADGSREIAAAYLDWLDAWQMPPESHRPYPAAAAAGNPGGVDDYTNGQDSLWDGFMVALHTDSDCMPLLRQIMDAREATPA